MIDAGRILPALEVPARAELVRSEISRRNLGESLVPDEFGLGPLLRVHSSDLIEFLPGAHELWLQRFGENSEPAAPWTWPEHRRSRLGSRDINALLGAFCADTLTPITPGAWGAAQSAANSALSAAEAVRSGERVAFALTRPPGHHASRNLYGGYCYLNNVAIAACFLLDKGHRPAILDVDYHHGNGTQWIFYDSAEVFFCSIHADPAFEYPYFSGYADERGEAAGLDCTLNLPLPHGTGWDRYEAALAIAAKAVLAHRPDVLLVSLGLDTFEADPEAFFRLIAEDYYRMGSKLAKMRLPTIFCFEGGYNVERLGEITANVLEGFLSP